MLATNELNNLTKELGYASLEEAATRQIELLLLSKIAKYKAENEFYTKKYNSDYNAILNQNNSEDFDLEDDLNDWKFVVDALKKCKEQYDSLNK